jgi:hypothetical protein
LQNLTFALPSVLKDHRGLGKVCAGADGNKVSVLYVLNVCIPSKIHILKFLTPMVMVLGGGLFEEVIRYA